MRLVLTIGSALIEFTERLSGGARPYLDDASGPRIQARAGFITGLGVGEAPSMTVTLCNTGNRVAKLVNDALRCRADFYDDDGSSFSGIVQSKSYKGESIVLTIGG